MRPRTLTLWLPALAAVGLVLTVGCGRQAAHPAGQKIQTASLDDSDWQMGLDRQPTATTCYAMARVMAAQGRDAPAATLLQRVLQMEPAYMPARVALAQVYLRQRQPEHAMTTLTEGLALAPDDTVLINDVGMVHLWCGRLAEALESFSRAASLAPTQARYRANQAMVLGMLGRYEESFDAYCRVLSPADAHHNLAVLCEARNDPERAKLERRMALAVQKSGQPGQRGRFLASSSQPAETACDTRPAEPASATQPGAETSSQ